MADDLQAPSRPKRSWRLVDFLVQFRWIVVIFVVLPISFTIYFMTYLGDIRSEWKSYKQREKEHDENVLKVMKRLKSRNASKDGLVCTARKPYIAVGMRNVDYKRARHFAGAYSDCFAPRFGGVDEPGAIPEKVPEFVEGMVYSPTEAVCMTGVYA